LTHINSCNGFSILGLPPTSIPKSSSCQAKQ
jgi:hypothetical protein